MRTVRMRMAALLGGFGVLLSAGIGAQAQTVRQKLKIDFEMQDSPSRPVTWTEHREITVLTPGGLQTASQLRISSSGNQAVEVLEATTRKKDGQVVPIDSADVTTQNGAVGPMASFADVKVQQLAFRDVAVGDTVAFTIRFTEREHYIPGQFSWRALGAPGSGEETFDVRITAPETIPIRHHERNGVGYSEQAGEGGTVVRRWTGTVNQPPVVEKNVADLDLAVPGFAFSTFGSYEAIGQAYMSGAASKARPTATLIALANQITAGRTDPRAQAEAIFDWITHNVRYVNVVFGAGRFVPNDVDTILARRFGDCKDQATLMTALLAAKGIAAEEVLINAGPFYTLPETPVLQAFNHVIVYIPSLDAYADPSTPISTFGHPPLVLLDKPVVRVSADGKASLARVPAGMEDDNVAQVRTRTMVASDGQIGSEATVEAQGDFAQNLRQFLATVDVQGEPAVMNALAQSRAMVGAGAIASRPATLDHGEPVSLVTKWQAARPVSLVEHGWRRMAGFTPIVAAVGTLVSVTDTSKRIYPVLCRPGRVSQEDVIEFPSNVTLRSPLPGPVGFRAGPISFEMSWSAAGNVVTIRIEATSSVTLRHCPPELANTVVDKFEAIREGLNPLFRFDAVAASANTSASSVRMER